MGSFLLCVHTEKVSVSVSFTVSVGAGFAGCFAGYEEDNG